MKISLPPAIRYFPVSKNAFAFSPGLSAIGENEKILQIDSNYPDYIQTKINNRQKSYNQFVQKYKLNTKLETATVQFLIKQLIHDWPEYFKIETLSKGHSNGYSNDQQLTNNLTSETLKFNKKFELLDSKNQNYHDALDALLSQIQEDMSIVTLGQNLDYIPYLHLCFPNFWSAKDKIGKSFIDAHKPVPDMHKINKSHYAISSMLASTGPFERFTWGLTTNKDLNQHPDDTKSTARRFDLAKNIYMRIERQVTVPLPEHNAYLFFIRTYFENTQNLTTEEKKQLIQSLRSMSEDIALYKGMAEQRDNIIERLK